MTTTAAMSRPMPVRGALPFAFPDFLVSLEWPIDPESFREPARLLGGLCEGVDEADAPMLSEDIGGGRSVNFSGERTHDTGGHQVLA